MEWHRSLLHVVERAKKQGIVFYGSGFWGKVAFEIFQLFGVKPVCFCDDDREKWETEYCGVSVNSLEKTVEKYKDAIYIMCADASRGLKYCKNRTNMTEKLKEKGVYSADTELRLSFYIFLLDIGPDIIRLDNEEKRLPQDSFLAEELKQIVLFNHMSNSGSYYLEQLLDGHSHMLFLPYVESLERVYVKRLQYLQDEELLVEMMAQMLGYFHSKYENMECIGQHRFQNFCTDEHGNFIPDILLDPAEFMIQLKAQFGKQVKLASYAHMLKIYFAAYNNCLGRKKKPGTEYWMFYHMHVPDFDVSSMYTYLHKEEFSRIENLVIIREPVQHCYSWIRRVVLQQKNIGAVSNQEFFTSVIHSEMGKMLQKQEGCENLKVIRFEDCKYHTEAAMKSLCRWLAVPYEPCMLDTTINGIKIYFPANTPEGVKYITGNDTSVVKLMDFSQILTLWDQARLEMIFGKFKRAYGYGTSVPEFTKWSEEEREHMLKDDFKFASMVENLLLEKGNEEDYYDVNEFLKSIFLQYMNEYQTGTEYYGYLRPAGNCEEKSC